MHTGNAELAEYDRKINENKNNNDIGSQISMIVALSNKGIALGKKGEKEAEISTYDEVIAKFKNHSDTSIRDCLAKTIFHKSVALTESKEYDKILAFRDELVEFLKNNDEPYFLSWLISAIVKTAIALGDFGSIDIEIELYNIIIDKLYSQNDPSLTNILAQTMFSKGHMLEKQGNNVDAINTYNSLINKFKDDTRPWPSILVAVSLLHKDINNAQATIRLISELEFRYKDLYKDKVFWSYVEGIHKQAKSCLSNPKYWCSLTSTDAPLPQISSVRAQELSLSDYINKQPSIKLTITNDHFWEVFFPQSKRYLYTERIFNLLITIFIKERSLLWRGTTGDYPLVPSLYRDKTSTSEMTRTHFNRYQLALRGFDVTNAIRTHEYGRKYPDTDVERILKHAKEQAEAWAFAQHYDSKSPMLDWTFSPYVAMYFAYEMPPDDRFNRLKKKEQEKYTARVLYALNPEALMDNQCGCTDKTTLCGKNSCPKTKVNKILPKLINNQRVVAQSGVLLCMPDGTPLEELLKQCKHSFGKFSLLKIYLPPMERGNVLSILNSMNINGKTLFPELLGAGKYANMALEIRDYDPMLAVFKDELEAQQSQSPPSPQ